jgi:hypothetical protein
VKTQVRFIVAGVSKSQLNVLCLIDFLMVYGCLDSRGINITRIYHRVTLCVQCLSVNILQMCIQL